MTTSLEVALIGGGRLAEVIARLLAASTTPMTITHWARSDAVAASFAERHPRVRREASVAAAARHAQVVVMAVPATALDAVATAYGEVARGDQVVLHACRGVGEGFLLGHQAIRARTCVRKIVALGGPLHARDLGTGRVLAAVAASRFAEGVDAVRAVTAGTTVRVHPSSDIIGVEVAGAMSNAWTLAAGMCDALELGETARGLLLTHGLVEAQRIGLALGADAATFAGLAGLSELIPRKVTSTDRHLAHGAALALGGADAVLGGADAGAVGPELEGVVTVRAALALAAKRRLKLPLLTAIGEVIGGRPAREVLEAVLQRDLEDLVLPRPAAPR